MKSLLLLSLAMAGPASAAVAETATPVQHSVEISVLTYNVHGLPWPAGQRRGAALKAIGRELAQMRSEGRQPDIVLIQEGFVSQTSALAQLSGYRFWAQGPARGERGDAALAPAQGKAYRSVVYRTRGEGWGKFTSAGLHVLSDAPITRVDTTAFHYCAGFDCLANKGAMLARIAVPGVPGGVDVVNTHLNSRGASKTPLSRTLQAHNLQIDELDAFITGHRDAAAPLLVGGDFNVRHAPERFEHDAATRPYAVVSQYCAGAPCEGQALGAETQPWLASQDLQAFASLGPVSVRPIKVETVFASPATGGRLSDHDGYLVHYRLSWTTPPGDDAA